MAARLPELTWRAAGSADRGRLLPPFLLQAAARLRRGPLDSAPSSHGSLAAVEPPPDF